MRPRAPAVPMLAFALAATLVFNLASCASSPHADIALYVQGVHVTDEQLAEVARPGATRRAARDALGEPTHVLPSAEGERWTYVRRVALARGADESPAQEDWTERHAHIQFNAEGIAVDAWAEESDSPVWAVLRSPGATCNEIRCELRDLANAEPHDQGRRLPLKGSSPP
ncbi:MAG: outer membrane protein assembly factor BamE [Planctomycetota bacterium]